MRLRKVGENIIVAGVQISGTSKEGPCVAAIVRDLQCMYLINSKVANMSDVNARQLQLSMGAMPTLLDAPASNLSSFKAAALYVLILFFSSRKYLLYLFNIIGSLGSPLRLY